MAAYLVFPPVARLRGEAVVPASKSATNRALLLAAVSRDPVLVENPLDSFDLEAMARALAAMGATISQEAGGWRVAGPLRASAGGEVSLDVAESGTAARFLAALASVVPGRWRIDGAPRMRERPMAELIEALRGGGARIECLGEDGYLPISIEGATLTAETVEIDASRSSQFASALLLAGAARGGGLEVRLRAGIVSAPYVATTLAMLEAFGHSVRRDPAWRVSPGTASPRRYRVPGDWSSALPLLAAAGVAGGVVALRGLEPASPDADALAARELPRMGVDLEISPDRVVARRAAAGLRHTEIDAGSFPDAVPALAALAAGAPGASRFTGIAHLRWKESDRIAGLCDLLAAAGAGTEAGPGESELTVVGEAAAPALRRLPTRGDHRLVMAAALLALARPGCLVENPDAVGKSYPAFFRDLAGLCVWRQ
ncbi:MAG TPA: 3-phosphoshikimate 1-carboxyvinyltransferase [Thermoanaerobaculia bacterium]